MTYDEIWRILVESDATDWYQVPEAQSAGAFLWSITTWHSGDDLVNIELESHHSRAVYRPDVSLGLAWGLRHQKDFTESWTDVFPDTNASSQYVDVLWNGMLIDRLVFVVVDGGRSTIPMPDRKLVERTVVGYWLTKRNFRFGGLIAGIKGSTALHTYQSYVERAGIVVEEARGSSPADPRHRTSSVG